jgi:hypothetical protein
VWSGNKNYWLITSRETACVHACVCVCACRDPLTVLAWHSHSQICYGFEKFLKKNVVLTLQRPQKPECRILDYVKVNLEYTIAYIYLCMCYCISGWPCSVSNPLLYLQLFTFQQNTENCWLMESCSVTHDIIIFMTNSMYHVVGIHFIYFVMLTSP